MEFSQVMERRTWRNLVHWCWRASAGLQWGFYNTFTVFFLQVALSLKGQYSVFISVHFVLFLQLCLQMAQNNMLVIHLSATKRNLVQTSFP